MFGRFDLVMLVLALAAIVLWKHRDNIERLINGTEPRIGGSKAQQGGADGDAADTSALPDG